MTVFGGMAASLDGFIRSEDGSLDWINDAMAPDEDYGFNEAGERSGAFVAGAVTYREMLENGMAEQLPAPLFVLTHDASLPRPDGVTFHDGDVHALLARIRSITDRDVCVYGGPAVLTEFLRHDLLDELGVSVIPVVLGGGLPFFAGVGARRTLRLTQCQPFPSGIVLLRYERVRADAVP